MISWLLHFEELYRVDSSVGLASRELQDVFASLEISRIHIQLLIPIPSVSNVFLAGFRLSRKSLHAFSKIDLDKDLFKQFISFFLAHLLCLSELIERGSHEVDLLIYISGWNDHVFIETRVHVDAKVLHFVSGSQVTLSYVWLVMLYLSLREESKQRLFIQKAWSWSSGPPET